MNLLPPPGPQRRRQLLLLVAIVVVLGGVMWYELRPTSIAPAASNSARPAAAPGALTLPAPVKLGDLAEVRENTDVGRNPFGFGVRPAPPAPPPMPQVLRPQGPPPAPPAPSGPPPIALKLIGMTVVETSGKRMATLKEPTRGDLFLVFEGDIVDGRYRVVKVGVESVVVSYLDGSGARTIPLGG